MVEFVSWYIEKKSLF